MLQNFVRKICPLMSLALAIGCGKKISEKGPENTNQTVEHQEPASVLTLQLDRQVAPRKAFTIPTFGVFILPSSLIVLQGSGVGRVKLSFNYEDNNDYEFHCYYTSSRRTEEMVLEVCQTSDNLSYSYTAQDIGEYLFPMNKNKFIHMEIEKAESADLVLDAVFNVDWK